MSNDASGRTANPWKPASPSAAVSAMSTRNGQTKPNRWLAWKVSLFFLAAGVWMLGAVTESGALTGAAIIILGVAIILRLFDRWTEDNADGTEGGE